MPVITQACQTVDTCGQASGWPATSPYPTIGRPPPSDTPMSTAFVIYVVAALGLTAPMAAQTAKPDFAGVWMITNVPTQPAATAGVGRAATDAHDDPSDTDVARDRPDSIWPGQHDDVHHRRRQGRHESARRTGVDHQDPVGREVTRNVRLDCPDTSAGVDEWDITETRTMDGRGHMIVERKQCRSER